MTANTHHSFDTGLAKEYGMAEAVVIHHLQHWIKVNKRLKKNKHEGRTWTYQTIEQIAANFEYLSTKQVERLLNRLHDEGVIIKGNFNKSKYDRTVWYAFENEEKFNISRNREKEIPESGNEDPETGTPIPYPKTDAKKEDKNTSPDARLLAHFLFSKMKEKNPKAIKPNFDKWEKEFDRMIRIDKRTVDEVKEILEWAYDGHFWPGAIRSPLTVRKNYDQIYVQMQGSKSKPENIKASQEKEKANTIEENKKYASEKLKGKRFPDASKYMRVKETGVEVKINNSYGIIGFSENGFKERIISAYGKINE